MILIITHKNDFTADFLIKELNSQKEQYLRFNCDSIQEDHKISFLFEETFSLTIDALTSFDSIWFRRTSFPSFPNKSNDEVRWLTRAYKSFFENLWLQFPKSHWVSLPSKIYQAENKLYQLQLAKSIGFTIPQTLITNNILKLESFIAKHNEEVIIKPLSDGHYEDQLIFTNKLRPDHIKNLKEFDIFPVIFQENILKEYELRVTIVGHYVFAARINSQDSNESKIDWRKGDNKFKPYTLPENIANKCKKLVNDLGLEFGAIDLIKSISGEYYFLEINPNGQWAWIEIQTGQPICKAIIELLTKQRK
jgi:glutathione synthase/RimK-type ligase-like ATP-grasp enzyme